MINLPTSESNGLLSIYFNSRSFFSVFYFFESIQMVLSKASLESLKLSKLKLN